MNTHDLPSDSAHNGTREQVLFESLLRPGETRLPAQTLQDELVRCGLREDDPRLAETTRRFHCVLESAGPDAMLTYDQFSEIIRPSVLLIDKILRGQLVIPEFSTFADELGVLFENVQSNRSGTVADYIPKLGRVDPELFGISVCTIDGQRTSFGDSHTPFSAQCAHKPINYCLALEEHGQQGVHEHIGCEPSGQSFNEITLDQSGRPHNPMLNSGAIMCGALIRPDLDVPDKFDHIINTWQRLGGGTRPGFDNTTYLSERGTADRNFALTYFMREHGAFPPGTDIVEALEFYIQCCSLEVTTELVSVVAATLAAGGLCPLTGERVLRADTVQKCLSFMYSCGMYDYSGEWAFRIGLPAKSGVSGVVMVVVPNVMGLCIWSPRLETHGNSVRAIDFCQRLVGDYNFHHYDNIAGGFHEKSDPRLRQSAMVRNLQVDLCWAASEGDVRGMRRLMLQGSDPNVADYDGRTALHLAASEGQVAAVRLLLGSDVCPAPIDRWGGTPLDDAGRGEHAEVVQVLQRALVEPSEAVPERAA